MQCYSELLPPSGVTHSQRLAFTSANATNLVVAKSSLLQIFDLRTFDETGEARLVLTSEYALQGTISALAKVKPAKSKSGGDALLVAFRDAKLSLIEWDPGQYSISTISIHYYENHDLLLCPWSPDLADCVSHLTVDPSSRCAAFNFNVSSLAIMPFHQANDDLAMDDDSDGSSEDEGNGPSTKHANGLPQDDKLYAPSFVLPMTALDPGLLHPIAMTFLYEYREPTIGVLFSTHAASMNTAPERKDVLTYAVYTLDIEQKASTTLLSVTNLPNDLQHVVAIPGPLGGTLLVGGNEVLHIDQGGRTNAVGVNEFSKRTTSFPMSDQSDLQVRLEGCQVQHLGNASSDMLLVLNNGHFLVLSFRVDGRSVSGLHLQAMDPTWTTNIFQAHCSTIADMGSGHLFLGSEEADSVLICTIRRVPQLKKLTSRACLDDTNGQVELDDEDEDDDDDDDDDLYADSKGNNSAQQGTLDGSSITLQDTLHSIAPLRDVVAGRPPKRRREDDDETEDRSTLDRLQLVASCNSGSRGSLAFLSRSILPRVVKRHKFARASAVWALSSELSELESDARPFDDMLVVSQGPLSSDRQASLLNLTGRIGENGNNDFERGDRAIACGRLATGSHVVVYARDVRAYNKDFGLDQIFAIVDEDAEATADVVAATITDTHVLIVKSDKALMLLKTDKSGDLDEVELPDSVPSEDILSACLYDDQYDFFNTKRYSTKTATAKALILGVLTNDGTFSLHPVSNLAVQVFSYAGVQFLPTHLSADLPVPKHWRNQDIIADMTLCSLGPHALGKPYFVLRNTSNDVTIYEPYQIPDVKGAYRFIKVSCRNGDPRETYKSNGEEDTDSASRCSMIPLHDVNGMSVVFVTGIYPLMISKAVAGMPHIHSLNIGPISHVSAFHDSACNRGWIHTNTEGELVFCELPADLMLEQADFVVRKVEIGEEVSGLTYYPRTGSYVLATSTPTPFHLPRDDEWHPEWDERNESTRDFLPTTRAHSLKLISSATHSIISQYGFSEDEEVLSIKCLSVEVSEQTHERKDLFVVGTGIARGENVVLRGFVYLFDVVDVAPHPEIPETDLKLKLITKEDVRGAVTALSSIGSQGFVLTAQGQKCMVRGLREDNAILPVAFMDMRYYVSVAKELPGSGLAILADAFAGLWLMGYSEEPYKMQLLSRDLDNPAVTAAEFLPQEKQLYIISSDGNGDLRILQYDPYNPKTERGSILLHRSTFNTGYLPTTMSLLPRSPTPSESLSHAATLTRSLNDNASDDGMDVEVPSLSNTHQVLITTREGAIASITPLSEQSYRRLSTLQTTLTTQLDQPCGLNPRAHRQVETDGVGGRAMIDGQLVKRWLEQSSQHKYSLADRVGGTVWDIRSDLEAISGATIGYL